MLAPDHTKLPAIARIFQIDGQLQQVAPFGGGHINDTFRLTIACAGRNRRFILQRLNSHVFKNPIVVMENIRRVTTHIASKMTGISNGERRVLRLVPTRDGQDFYRDEQGNCWRMFPFVEQTRTVDVVESSAQAFAVAQAFGEFQKLLSDLPAPRLHETIPDFHNTPNRFAALEKAIATDSCHRAALAGPEIEFALRHKPICDVLFKANPPERVTHNDTKINNVLLDETTGEGLCVIDLDTVMPGVLPCDFGDLVRSAANSTREDELDLAKVEMQFALFEALLRGYVAGAGEMMTAEERILLPVAGQVIAFELGLRFLADFLAGDVYFKTRREGQNLDRCRVQFKLFESMQRQEPAMRQLLNVI